MYVSEMCSYIMYISTATIVDQDLLIGCLSEQSICLCIFIVSTILLLHSALSAYALVRTCHPFPFFPFQVATPPSSLDVFSETQLVNQLATLIANHLDVQRWCFKLNNSVHSRGIAYCDIAPHLSCHPWLRKERDWYGDKWNSKWAQEMAVKKVAEELSDLLGQHTVMVDPAHFPTWRDFLAEMRTRGGLIQACPHSESVTALTVSVLIEPDGAVQILNAGDQVHPTPFWNWGVSVPQTSVDPATLSSAVSSVAAACRERGVYGHLSVDFVTFIAPSTVSTSILLT